ncbi:fimbria/pilus outer membrane usher protein [Paraburkholderia oxyphila]|uniref:fimbria/pilus outer membrane usher protein n=1 Tax=Paraburkholderia oxyphila TaxID=614212 RepID=UPI001428A21A|nr:fimbria/pilus outer membrane usher protein [Paraburkholderia oxyphila]
MAIRGSLFPVCGVALLFAPLTGYAGEPYLSGDDLESDANDATRPGPSFLPAVPNEHDADAPESPANDEDRPQLEPIKAGVYVNGRWNGYYSLTVRDDGLFCVPVSDWLEWGVAEDARFVPDGDAGATQCAQPQRLPAGPQPDTPGDADEAVRLSYDASQQRMTVRIDASLLSHSRGSVQPARLDHGVSALLLDYQFSASRSEGTNVPADGRSTTLYGTINGGANFGPWRFRTRQVYSRGSVGPPQWENLGTWLQRDIASLRARLLIGEGTTDSLLFDGVPFTGVQLASEDDLRPDYLTRYAPVVRGMALGNAEVFVRQRGVLIYHANVAPGPFAFHDVHPPSSSGDLNVTIREADGTERVTIIPYISMPLLLHERDVKYAFNVGRYRRESSYERYAQPEFMQATLGFGLPLGLSPFAGIVEARGYRSTAAGAGWSLGAAGAASLDVARSNAAQPGGATTSGYRFRARYAKTFATSGTGISIDWRRFTGEGFRTLTDQLQRDADRAFWRELFGDDAPDAPAEAKRRSQLRLDVRQNFGDTANLYATLSAYRYTGSSPSRLSTQIGASWYGERFDIDVQAGWNRFANQSNVAFMATLSITLSIGWKRGALRYAASVNRDDDGALAWGNQLSGSALRDYRLSYSLSQQRSSDTGHQYGARLGYQANAGRIDAGYENGRGYRKTDLALAGGVVGYRGGVVAGQSLGETLAVVDAPGYADASVDGQLGTRTNSSGRAVISHLTPYRVNRVGLDGLELGDDLDYTSLFREVAPTLGAVIYVPIRPQRMLPPG